ncbi:MAG: type I-B CRISPR-associated protein Cas7/Cst2/DevR [Campylobacteraceae bacterium]|jgi:CRISPR-associated protein Cst2|nr:type I-B CRISPR-associated protein Cas7/Cst2/DevR [Campylobacteraceae bacterium]
MSSFKETIEQDSVKNYFLHGFVLVDVDGASLNNWGKDSTNTQGMDNTTAVKKVFKNGRTYAVVSGQAWRYWWREALGLNGWSLSPVTRDTKVAFTDANPVKYADDDIFGYMRASKEIEKDTAGEIVVDNKGKPKKVDVSVTRVSPLKNSILTSVTPVRIANEFSSMTRQDGDVVPYEKQAYSAVLKGIFSLDLDQTGTFTKINRSGYKNITESAYQEILNNNGKEVSDLINPNIKRARLDIDTRRKRAKDTLIALKTIAGGAKRATNYVSVKPDFIILAVLKGGNNIFDNVAVDDDGRATISLKAIEDSIKDNKEYFRSDVYIGKATGFMEDTHIKIQDIEGVSIKVGSVNAIIDEFVKVFDTVIL